MSLPLAEKYDSLVSQFENDPEVCFMLLGLVMLSLKVSRKIRFKETLVS